MTTELIDWATVPVGVMTNWGKLNLVDKLNTAFCFCKIRGANRLDLYNLRLAPADQQPWLVYEEGVTVLPEWAEVTYLVAKGSYHEDVELFKEDEYPRRVNNPVVQYKLGDTEGKLFKDGWTHNPSEVEK